MHTNMHCTDSSQVGGCGCWVGSHIGSHDKRHTQDIILFTIIYIVHCLHMYCVCMMDLLIMPKRLVLIATYTCGEGEWVVGL